MNYILLLWPNRIRYSLINKLIDCNQNEWVDIVDTHNISFADSSACLLPCAMQCAMLPCAELFRPPPSAFCLCLRDSSSCSLSDADQSDVGPVMRLHNVMYQAMVRIGIESFWNLVDGHLHMGSDKKRTNIVKSWGPLQAYWMHFRITIIE